MKTKGRGSGVEVEWQVALVYKLANGKIVRGDYFTTESRLSEPWSFRSK